MEAAKIQPDQNVIVDQASGLVCVHYILETELENYEEWCEENNFDPANLKENNHVYAKALLAVGHAFKGGAGTPEGEPEAPKEEPEEKI